jgi:hypothetical protein
MELTKETSKADGLQHGHQTVGATPVALCHSFQTLRGILVRCPGTNDPVPNTAPVWIGRAGVTADSGPRGGFPILPGHSLHIPIDDPALLICVSTVEDQDIAWMGA